MDASGTTGGRTGRVSLPPKVSNSPTTTPLHVPTSRLPPPRTGPAFAAFMPRPMQLATSTAPPSGFGRAHARERGRREALEPAGDDGESPRKRPFDPLDSASRSVAQLAPPISPGAPAVQTQDAPPPLRALTSMEELLPRLVRRIAWSGDRTRGSVQLELGAGPHAGTVVTVHAEDRRVRVELQGAGADELGSRIEARLARQGFEVERP